MDNTSPRRIHVLHLRDTYEIGGPGKTIIETFRALNQERFCMHLGVFTTMSEPDETPFVSAAKAAGLPVHFLRGTNRYDPRFIVQMAGLVKAFNIDIVHAHEVKSDVIAYLAAQVHPVTILTTLHGWIANGLKQRLLTALDKRVAKRFDCVIAVSRAIEDEMLALGVSRSKLRLLHNAIVVERYCRTGTRGMLQEVVGRPLTSPVLSSIGRLSVEKGHGDLIEAIALVRKAGHKVSLVLVGDGPERQHLIRKIGALDLSDCIHLPGYLHDTQRLLEDVDLMVLPSHTEGLPNAILEALLMEVPVLATRVGGTPEVITDGETGRLVAPHSPTALANGILDFIANKDSWIRMARQGRKVVQKQFDFHARTRQLEALYRELLKKSTAA